MYRIGKNKSVVSREIRRNVDKRNRTYKAELVQRKYAERMPSKPKACKFTDEIKTIVDKLLANDYSPEQIAGRCKLKGTPYLSHLGNISPKACLLKDWQRRMYSKCNSS